MTRGRLSVFGLFRVGRRILKAVHDLGGSEDDLRRLLIDPQLGHVVAQTVIRWPSGVPGPYPLVVDYSQSLAKMVKAGPYDSVQPDITAENFPVMPGEARVEAVLFCARRVFSYDQVLREMSDRGMRPATLVELAAFGTQYAAEFPGEFMVTALGSVRQSYQGSVVVCCLGKTKTVGLTLHTMPVSSIFEWSAQALFLAVRK